MNPSLVMTTFNRDPAYVQDSLASLYANDPSAPDVLVSVSELTADCLGDWRGDHRVQVRCFTEAELAVLHGVRPVGRTAVASRVALGATPGDVILLQDDIIFAPNWWQTTLAALEHTRTICGSNRIVVQLYCPYDITLQPVNVLQKSAFYGCQAVYMEESIKLQLVEQLKARPEDADDVVLREMMHPDDTIHLRAINPSVVQHVGRRSTCGSEWFHQAPTFGRVVGA